MKEVSVKLFECSLDEVLNLPDEKRVLVFFPRTLDYSLSRVRVLKNVLDIHLVSALCDCEYFVFNDTLFKGGIKK